MPLLMSKINDTMPNIPGYAFTSVTGSSHDTDLYGESEQAYSSNGSSPLESPPFSALEQQSSHPFGGSLPELGSVSASLDFREPTLATTMDYHEMPLQMFPQSSLFAVTEPSGYGSE